VPCRALARPLFLGDTDASFPSKLFVFFSGYTGMMLRFSIPSLLCNLLDALRTRTRPLARTAIDKPGQRSRLRTFCYEIFSLMVPTDLLVPMHSHSPICIFLPLFLFLHSPGRNSVRRPPFLEIFAFRERPPRNRVSDPSSLLLVRVPVREDCHSVLSLPVS